MPPELLIITMLRAIVEIAAWFMIAQGFLYVLAGRKRNDNFVYQLFSILTRPVFKLTRAISPRLVQDQHIPYAAFLLLLWLWIGLAIAKRSVCASQALPCAGGG